MSKDGCDFSLMRMYTLILMVSRASKLPHGYSSMNRIGEDAMRDCLSRFVVQGSLPEVDANGL